MSSLTSVEMNFLVFRYLQESGSIDNIAFSVLLSPFVLYLLYLNLYSVLLATS